MEQFYTVHEVAKKLGMNEFTIREKIRKGEFNGKTPSLKNGRDYRIPESGIEAYIENNSVTAPNPVNLRGFYSTTKKRKEKPEAYKKIDINDILSKRDEAKCTS